MSIIVGYARVSTEEQAFKQALEQQVFRLKTAGAQKVYADIASRAKDDRGAILEVLRLAEAGAVGTVLVTRLDRITSSPGLFEKISSVFQRHNVKLVALDEHVDVHSVDGEFSAGLQVWFARREVKTISLRIRKAREASRMKAKPNQSVPWAYRVVNGAYQLDHTPFLCLLIDAPVDGGEVVGRTKAQLGRDIVDLFFEGSSLSRAIQLIHAKYGIQKFKRLEAQKQFHVFEEGFDYKQIRTPKTGVFRWSRDGIRVYLTNPVLQGHTPYLVTKLNQQGKRAGRATRDKWDVRYNTHPSECLISSDEARQIEDMLTYNKRVGGWNNFGKNRPPHILTGLLYCAECGRRLKTQSRKQTKQSTYYYFQCKNYIERACPAKTLARDTDVETAAINAFVQRATAIATLAGQPSDEVEPTQLQELRSQLSSLEQIPGYQPAIETAKQELRSQIQNFQHQLSQEQQAQDCDRDFLLSIARTPLFWQTLSLNDKREIFRKLVSRIVIRHGQVEQVLLKV